MTSTFFSILLMTITMMDPSQPITSSSVIHSGEIDLEASTLKWTGKKVAGTHTGLIKLKAGNLEMDENHQLIGGAFEIDMKTMTCTDLDGEWGQKLLGHLKSEDFFEVNKFPSAFLKITKVTPGNEAGYYLLESELTIKGITKVVSFTSELRDGIFSSAIKVDRTKYDIKYGSGSFFDDLGDKAIDNDFMIDVNLVLK